MKFRAKIKKSAAVSSRQAGRLRHVSQPPRLLQPAALFQNAIERVTNAFFQTLEKQGGAMKTLNQKITVMVCSAYSMRGATPTRLTIKLLKS
jgi:hypothetical protein